MLMHGRDQDTSFDKEMVMEEQNIYKNQEDINMNSFK